MSEAEILFERRGAAGVITLNRPRALNALTREMCVAFGAALREWDEEDGVAAVVVRSTGARAFCAGGDIRTTYERGRAGDPAALGFFRDEYRTNLALKAFRKPCLSLIEGVVMGGGVGISIHGSHRLGAEGTMFAMPECGIGLVPDVGATHVLPRMPGEVGAYLALTGARLSQADALWCGALTHAVPAAAFVPLLQELAESGDVGRAVGDFSRIAPDAPLAARRDVIDRCFGGPSVAGILDRLDAEEGEDAAWARETAATIRTKSPTSLKLALRLVRLGAGLDFEECLRTEFRVVSRILAGHDFYEGTRAVVIDKDNAPQWRPGSLDEVPDEEMDRHFAPLGADELALP